MLTEEDSFSSTIGGIVENKRETNHELRGALRTALQKGLITTNQINNHVKLRDQLYKRNYKSQSMSKRPINQRSRNKQNMESQFIKMVFGSSNDNTDADHFNTAPSVFYGKKADIHARKN